MTGRRGTTFSETMTGTVRLPGEDEDRPVRLQLAVRAPEVLRLWGTTHAVLTGRVLIGGWADDPQATGELEISPVARRRIRYRIHFDAGGQRCTLDGWKSVSALRPLRSMTVLPFSVTAEEMQAKGMQAEESGRGTVRFPVATQLLPFLASFRFPRQEDIGRLMAPRWDGTPGRTEV
ncbi:hypothetical protein [Peterkaempfera sp. SMS 1(5)a]|uniref:hypothetical protein n=1 Tax=Peterkaempfera podocarpi TaxID=3232308 RepID=UPI00366D691B